ncbi:cysteine hydrolase family protein [Actinoplanes sichuanensis]|uniref:Cysteine hydrolase family protein n=1 Tax=Actinoplanes sichuanensis TaxID=512349 RepID=A0ABW4ARV6_9ACTN|nr:isochorismatase family cysteine hydrolase [Actinoplanes sichuanensis]
MSDHLAPHWDSAALVVIDMQADFTGIEGTVEVIPQVGALASAFRAAGRPIVHIVRLYAPGSDDIDLPRRALDNPPVAPGSPGSEIIAGLPGPVPLDPALLLSGRPQTVGDDEIVLFKPRWGAFYRTDLEAWLRERGVDTVVVAGCNLPNCPRATLFEASERDFRTVIVSDAVSQTSGERLADLASIGVQVLSVGAVADSLPG